MDNTTLMDTKTGALTRALVMLLAAGLLAGCGDSANTESMGIAESGESAVEQAVVQTADTRQTAAPVVQAQAPRTVTVGSLGGSLRLTEHIGAVYSVSMREGSAVLEGVALLRGTERGWFNNDIDQAPLALTNVGVGGGYKAAVTNDNGEVIWLSNRTYKSAEKANKKANKKAEKMNKKGKKYKKHLKKLKKKF